MYISNIYVFVAELWILQMMTTGILMITLIVLNKAVRDATKTIFKTVIGKTKVEENGSVTYLTPEEEVMIDEEERRNKGIY